MTDIEIMEEYYACKFYEQMACGRTPTIMSDADEKFFEDTLRRWAEEDEGIIDTLRENARALQDPNNWEEIEME